MALVYCEITWLQYILHNHGIKHQQPVKFYCDNQATLYISSNHVFHDCTKQIEIDCHLFREKFQAGTVKTFNILTSKQLVDIFTKPLGSSQFSSLVSKLRMINIYSNARGSVKDHDSSQIDP